MVAIADPPPYAPLRHRCIWMLALRLGLLLAAVGSLAPQVREARVECRQAYETPGGGAFETAGGGSLSTPGGKRCTLKVNSRLRVSLSSW